MSITGGVKFFKKSMSLLVDGASMTASSGDDSSAYALDQNPSTYWRSVSSTDAVTETLTVTFSENKTINRLILSDINFKEFTVKYDLAGTWTNFTSVFGMDGSKANISETVFADDCAYYEFDSVTTGKIQITCLKTQVVNAQKYVSQIIATSELGTFQGYPEISEVEMDRNAKIVKTISGKYSIQKGDETASFDIAFKGYPSASTYNVDVGLALVLHDLDSPFLVWLCGGRRGTNYFRYTLRGFRLKDIFQMQITKSLKLKYSDNVYVNQLNAKMTLEEVIDNGD
jgi:hypothetical protein